MKLRVRPWLDRIDPYKPGSHASSGDGSLASNESPLGPSQHVIAAVSTAASTVHRYPDPLAIELRNELAAQHGVDADRILVGNGSDELIYLLSWAYLAHDGRVVCADPADRIDEISAHVVNARITKVPLVDWRHDLDAMARADADIAYVVNPHNPTGTVRSRRDIEEFVAASPAGLVVIDEAYIEFADDPTQLTAIPLVAGGRVAVMRTFSKIHGLAGLRIGYLIADADIIATLRKIRPPFSVGSVAQAGAVAAARDTGYSLQVRDYSIRRRAKMIRLFERAGFTVVPSQANFVLVETNDEEGLVNRLNDFGISVRPGSSLGVPGTVRVSVPSETGHRMLARALGQHCDTLSADERA
jgi:histidinol-phosphate aminotransferase